MCMTIKYRLLCAIGKINLINIGMRNTIRGFKCFLFKT